MKLLAALSILFIGFSTPAIAEEAATVSNISVSGAYAYATTKVQRHGAVFMEITNNGDTADKVIAATADKSEKVELHTHTMDEGIMMMREVESYELPVGETTTLEPMGHHIMLMGLNAPLAAGETFPVTLTLENQGAVEVQVEIKALGDGTPMDMDH
jgi:copper(I)-binding protein